jgi:hypothetical protein
LLVEHDECKNFLYPSTSIYETLNTGCKKKMSECLQEDNMLQNTVKIIIWCGRSYKVFKPNPVSCKYCVMGQWALKCIKHEKVALQTFTHIYEGSLQDFKIAPSGAN